MSEANKVWQESCMMVVTAATLAQEGLHLVREAKQSDISAEDLQTLKKLSANLVGRAIGSAAGLVCALPFYLVNRGAEEVGLVPALVATGLLPGAAIWAMVGDRSSPTEFLLTTLGAGLLIVPIAFIWALMGDKK